VLPPIFETPTAVVLVLAGALSCFAGYRFFRTVLGVFGFILGAMVASSIMGVSNSMGMIVAAIAGGVVGSIIFVLGYFVGVALIGAGMGTTIAHVVWGAMRTGDPPWQLIILASVAGALGAMWLQRYVMIVGTAFAGSWTIILGGTALAGERAAAKAAAAADPWILYPLNPVPGARWIYAAWIALGLVGTGVQLAVTAKKR
jgi:hypothetical protein